jgi:CcmD family protein
VSLRTAIEYVAAVYLLTWIAIFVYMALIGQKVTRIERDLDRIEQALETRDTERVERQLEEHKA